LIAKPPGNQEGTSEMKRNAGRPSIVATTGGTGVAAHAGARLFASCDELGLGRGLSGPWGRPSSADGHDRGQVLIDLAAAIADGATSISDLRVLADQPALLGELRCRRPGGPSRREEVESAVGQRPQSLQLRNQPNPQPSAPSDTFLAISRDDGVPLFSSGFLADQVS
jgi:hypothetical protein